VKKRLLLIIVSIAAALTTSVAFADPPTLTALNVRFHMPKCDDRDQDTITQIWVDKGGIQYADNSNVAPGQQFKDPGDHGPFAIPIENAITKDNYVGSVTHIHINPNGHDTWCTRIDMEAIFTDNSKINTSSGVVVKISESNKDAVFVNQP